MDTEERIFMKKKVRNGLFVVLAIILLLVILVVIQFISTKKKVDSMVNVEIDMKQVADGTYTGSSDVGLVKAEVEVEVKEHKIVNINLLKHQCGKGQPAESTLNDMIKNNTDNVDTVSGATTSSKTIRNAVNNALQKGLK